MAYKLIQTTDKVRSKLSGIKTVLDYLGDGEVDSQLTDALTFAQEEFEETTHVKVWSRIALTYPTTQILGTDYDVKVDPLDYYSTPYSQSAFFQMPLRPITSVQRIAIEYGPTQTLLTYPANWLRIDHMLGTISIVPPIGAGLIGSSVGSEQFLPLLRGGFLRGVTPLMVSIDYTAGIPDADTAPQWSVARETISKLAAATFRENNAGLIANSTSRDGVSVSFDDNPGQMKSLREQAAMAMDRFQRNFAPIRLQFA